MGALICLVGPTGAGKTAAALTLALEHGLEVVSLDSVQVYRGLDIGSAKPSVEERRRVPHHLIDIVDPDARFNAADWLARAEAAIADVRGRGRVPIVVGGTGLYLRMLERGLAPLPAADDALRATLLAEEEEEPGRLHRRLSQVDPASAARLQPRDRVRIVRALEVHALSGRPLSAHLEEHVARRSERPLSVIRLEPPEAVMGAALAARTEAMLSAGLVEEARALRARYGPVRPLGSVGYKEALELCDGRFHPSELGGRITTATRQFARRQRTWWRSVAAATTVADAAGVRAALERALRGTGQP
jgi:tRNA dimethylallyltransferase